MKFYSYGCADLPAIMLIHGGGNSGWLFGRAAELLKDRYYVIVPELDGHGEESSVTYISTEEEADKIIRYINENLGGRLLCIAGISLGSQIAMEVLSRKTEDIGYAFLESGICRPKKASARMMSWRWVIRCMEEMYKWKWLVTLQCKYSAWPVSLADRIAADAVAVSTDSNYNMYRTYFNYKIPENLRKTTAKVLLIYGSKEGRMMKKDIQYAASEIAGSKIGVFEGFGHCGCILSDPKAYTDKLVRFIEEGIS